MKNEMASYRLEYTANLNLENAVFIDTETTGLTPGKDEVLSIAIVDKDGNEVFYSLIRPLERKRWPNAAEIHGITWKDVKDAPTILDIGNEVADILESADLIVGYNLEFDMDMLIENGLPDVDSRRYDLMDEYAQAYGRWSDRKEDYLWVKLEQCARHYGYGFDAHNALEDAKATAFCLQRFMEECAAEIPAAQEREEVVRAGEAERERVAKQKQEEMSKGIDRQYRLLIAIVVICLLGGGYSSMPFRHSSSGSSWPWEHRCSSSLRS